MSTPNTESAARAADRVRARDKSGDLDDLWPDFPAEERRAAWKQIRTVVTAVLAGSDRRPVIVAREAKEARAVGMAAFAAGVGPLLGHWIERGVVDASEPVRSLLLEHRAQGARRIAMLRGQVITLVRSLREEGVDPILLKGMHTGAEYFPDPATRTASDIDFLVRPNDAAKVASVLSRLGFAETLRSSFARRSTWMHASAPRVPHSIEVDGVDNPWTVDILVGLERWYFRRTRRDLGDAVFRTTSTVRIEGESIRVLEQPFLTAFLALHASWHLRHMQLIRLIELILVLRKDRGSSRLSFDELEALLARTDTGRFAYPALALADELAPGTVDARILGRLAKRSSARMRRVLDRIRREELGPLNERSPDLLLAWAVGAEELAWNALEIIAPSDDALGSTWRVLGRRLGFVVRRATAKLARMMDPRTEAGRGRPEADRSE